MSERKHPPALPHGELREVFPDVFFVTGTIAMPGPLPVRFSRNMTVIREGERLVVVNAVRLGDEGLRALDALGKVTDVIRLAGFHGMDDPFYKSRSGAKVWAVRGQRYTSGFDAKAPATYLSADEEMDASTALPVKGARLYVFDSAKPPEALLLLDREGGVVVAGDCLQNWAETDRYFSGLGKVMMKWMGFIRPHNVGPAWLKQTKPDPAELRGILELPFEHVLPAHGAPVVNGAREAYRASVERAAARAS